MPIISLAGSVKAPEELTLHRQILLAGSEDGVSPELAELLRSDGHQVDVLHDGAQVWAHVMCQEFDLVILEHPVPGQSGLDICRAIRAGGGQIPIMMITGDVEVFEKVVALRLGADDYVTRPFDPAELLARVDALIRRGCWSAKPKTGLARFGNIVVDFQRPEVSRDGKSIPISAKELQLLRFLLEHRGHTVARAELLREVWGIGFASSTRTLDVHVAALRRKIEDDPKRPYWLLTIHGIGYRFRE